MCRSEPSPHPFYDFLKGAFNIVKLDAGRICFKTFKVCRHIKNNTDQDEINLWDGTCPFVQLRTLSTVLIELDLAL